MSRLFLLCLLLSLLHGTPLRADDAVDQLLEAMSGMQQLTGRFRQRQYGEDGQAVMESLGRFRLLRPGYFAWEIESPGSQLIIADPEGIWHYDRDLETASRRPVEGGYGQSPLQVLGGDETALREGYRITREGDGVFLLVPESGNPGFRQLRVTMRAYLIESMEIVDNLNQRVDIDFGELEVDAGLTPEDFAFQPPEGVDVFYYEQ
jgi:outer membrane lipoprotein carrier protein